MRTDDVTAKREQALAVHAEMSELSEAAVLGQRDLTAEESKRFATLSAQYRTLTLEAGSASPSPGRFEAVYGAEQGGLAAAFRSAGWTPKEPAEIPWAEFRAFTWTGSVDNIAQLHRQAGGYGADQRYAYPAFPQVSVGSDNSGRFVFRGWALTVASNPWNEGARRPSGCRSA